MHKPGFLQRNILSSLQDATNYRWGVLALLFSVQAVSSMAVFCFGPLAPVLQDKLDITRAQVGMFSSAIYLGMVLFSTHAGWLTDKYGTRLFLVVGLGATGLLFLILALSRFFFLSLLVVFFAGVGYQFINPTTIKAIIVCFPLRLRGTAIGIKQAGVSFGGAVVSAILPFLIIHIGWQGSIAFIGICILVSTLLVTLLYRETPIKSFSEGESSASKKLLGILRILKNRNLLLLGTSGAMYSISITAFFTYLVLYLKESFSFSILLAGSFLAIAQIGVVVGRILWGIIIDRFFGGRRKVPFIIIGFLIAFMSVMIICVLPLLPYWAMYIFFANFGFSFGYTGIFFTFLAELGEEMTATSVGFGAAAGALGIVIGTPVFGYVVDKTGSYNLAWGYLVVVAIIGAFMAFFVHEGEGNTKSVNVKFQARLSRELF